MEHGYRVNTIIQEEMIEAQPTVGEVEAIRCGKLVEIF